MKRVNALAWTCAVALALAVPGRMAAERAQSSSARREQPSSSAPVRRYRIVAKVRFLFVWVGSDDVGSARLTSTPEGGTHVNSLLIGTDPRRARGLNQWGYIREAASGDEASVFGLRTLGDVKSLKEGERRLAEGAGPAAFGAICSVVTAGADDSWTTTVRGSSTLSYRDLPRLLDLLGSARWHHSRIARPSGSEPGFLAAVTHLIDETIAAAPRGPLVTAYVYKGNVYDLAVHDVHRAGDVIHAVFSIHSRASGARTDFEITYGARGDMAGVPIDAVYKPHWWLRLELVLDPSAPASEDPAADPSTSGTMRRICAQAAR